MSLPQTDRQLSVQDIASIEGPIRARGEGFGEINFSNGVDLLRWQSNNPNTKIWTIKSDNTRYVGELPELEVVAKGTPTQDILTEGIDQNVQLEEKPTTQGSPNHTPFNDTFYNMSDWDSLLGQDRVNINKRAWENNPEYMQNWTDSGNIAAGFTVAPFATAALGEYALPWLANTGLPAAGNGAKWILQNSTPSALTNGISYYLPQYTQILNTIGQGGDALLYSYLMANGLNNLISDNGIDKTVNLFSEGNYLDGTISAAGDLLDVASMYPFGKAITPTVAGSIDDLADTYRFFRGAQKYYKTLQQNIKNLNTFTPYTEVPSSYRFSQQQSLPIQQQRLSAPQERLLPAPQEATPVSASTQVAENPEGISDIMAQLNFALSTKGVRFGDLLSEAANNSQGLLRSRGKYVMLRNPDTGIYEPFLISNYDGAISARSGGSRLSSTIPYIAGEEPSQFANRLVQYLRPNSKVSKYQEFFNRATQYFPMQQFSNRATNRDNIILGNSDNTFLIFDPATERIQTSTNELYPRIPKYNWVHLSENPSFESPKVELSYPIPDSYPPFSRESIGQDWVRLLGLDPTKYQDLNILIDQGLGRNRPTKEQIRELVRPFGVTSDDWSSHGFTFRLSNINPNFAPKFPYIQLPDEGIPIVEMHFTPDISTGMVDFTGRKLSSQIARALRGSGADSASSTHYNPTLTRFVSDVAASTNLSNAEKYNLIRQYLVQPKTLFFDPGDQLAGMYSDQSYLTQLSFGHKYGNGIEVSPVTQLGYFNDVAEYNPSMLWKVLGIQPGRDLIENIPLTNDSQYMQTIRDAVASKYPLYIRRSLNNPAGYIVGQYKKGGKYELVKRK